MYIDWNVIDSSQAFVFTKDNSTQTIVCVSSSYPDANITVYDTHTMNPLSSYSQISKSCWGSTCYNYLYVYFQFTNNTLDNLTSITCAVDGFNSQYYLSRDVLVLPSGTFYIYFWVKFP